MRPKASVVFTFNPTVNSKRFYTNLHACAVQLDTNSLTFQKINKQSNLPAYLLLASINYQKALNLSVHIKSIDQPLFSA